MFDFLSMADNYEDRAVARYDSDGLTIDTCSVTDSEQPYETGIEHPLYNDGKWVIVEMYDSEEEAQQGHDKWVKVMTKKKLPDSLTDVSTATIKRMLEAVSSDDESINLKAKLS